MEFTFEGSIRLRKVGGCDSMSHPFSGTHPVPYRWYKKDPKEMQVSVKIVPHWRWFVEIIARNALLQG